jgi:hypothetical protein
MNRVKSRTPTADLFDPLTSDEGKGSLFSSSEQAQRAGAARFWGAHLSEFQKAEACCRGRIFVAGHENARLARDQAVSTLPQSSCHGEVKCRPGF